MLRLCFTAEDLLRVTVAKEPAPLLELTLAAAVLRRNDPLFAGWRKRLLPRAVRPLLDLVPATGKGPLFLDPPCESVDEGVEQVRSTPTSAVRTELQRLHAPDDRPGLWVRLLADGDRETFQALVHAVGVGHEHLVAPSWERIRAGFHAEQAWRGRLLAEQGLRATLTGLVQGARWQGTTLEIDRPGNSEFHLGGRGLALLPSVFWTGRPLVGWYPDGNILVYPAITPLPLLDGPSPEDALAALLGRSRAAMLEQLTQPRTTTDLARGLGMAKSSVSEHATTLRNSRLISTRRDGKSVWHACTPLGLSLLNGSNVARPSLLQERATAGTGPCTTPARRPRDQCARSTGEQGDSRANDDLEPPLANPSTRTAPSTPLSRSAPSPANREPPLPTRPT